LASAAERGAEREKTHQGMHAGQCDSEIKPRHARFTAELKHFRYRARHSATEPFEKIRTIDRRLAGGVDRHRPKRVVVPVARKRRADEVVLGETSRHLISGN